MTLALDPRLPLLWRSPDSVQLGVDNPPVTLTAVSTAHERMLAGLTLGLTPHGLLLIGTEAGLNATQVEDFARQIRPALVTPRAHSVCCVEIDGSGPTADRLEWRLREAGVDAGRSQNGQATLAIVVGDYVLDPERRGRWLRRDIPHLPIIFGDTSVTLGPFIEPGTGPCLFCLELHRRDADPAWPALASQLLGTKSRAQSPFVASEVATLATRIVLTRHTDGPDDGPVDGSKAITIDVATGQISPRAWRPHDECSCTGIASASEQDQQETSMAG